VDVLDFAKRISKTIRHLCQLELLGEQIMKHSFRIFSLLVGLALLIGLALPAAHQQPASILRAHPQLLLLAKEDPTQRVSVIVQMMPSEVNLEAQVERLGGTIAQRFTIINAFSAELSASAIQELAANPAVRWISPNAAMQTSVCADCVDTSKLANNYIRAIRADQVWNKAPYIQGQGIGVAVLDSGVNYQDDLYSVMGQNRVVASVNFQPGYNASTFDGYGHGSHVAGVVGGNGRRLNGKYIGVAPKSNIINVKVCDDLKNGLCTAESVVKGLQWVLENKATYNIRVVNISLNSSVAESYHVSPIDAAVEVLWFNGIVVVASAGNQGQSNLYAPANDPFAIVVGAVDDVGTAGLGDDKLASFSSYGSTSDGFARPDLVAPGKNVVSLMGNSGMGLAADHASNIQDGTYFRMSGTSVAAPMVSGAVALLLQDEPTLTPDQVKYRLMATANKNWPGYNQSQSGAGYLDVYAAVTGTTTQSANTGTLPSQLLSTGSAPISWGSIGWNSIGWNSIGWNSIGWNSIGWNSIGWNSDYWGP
jgi:serine protease AprX